MFSCGWLPPVGRMQAGFMATLGLAAKDWTLLADHKFPARAGRSGRVGGTAHRRVVVRGKFGNVKRVRGLTAALTQ